VNPTNDRQQQLRTGRQLEYFTLGWNLTEAAVAVGAGVFAGSIALIGFGIDSLIEVCPGEFCCGACMQPTQPKNVSASR
jgi:divalent metal cation (Fe/Co/Zn/Cd) transporter